LLFTGDNQKPNTKSVREILKSDWAEVGESDCAEVGKSDCVRNKKVSVRLGGRSKSQTGREIGK
jgi:hypothetical protein